MINENESSTEKLNLNVKYFFKFRSVLLRKECFVKSKFLFTKTLEYKPLIEVLTLIIF
jgi:hypothetical protein